MPGNSGQLAAGPPRCHVVQLYGDDRDLAAGVGSYLGEGLVAEDSTVVVATLPHRVAFEAELSGAGIDVTAAISAGRLQMLDAADALRGFWTGERLDRDRVDAAIGALIDSAAATGQPIRIYAEMVALLWDAGHVGAAIELESLWNDLTLRRPFSLRCAYPARLVTGEASVASVEDVYRLHTEVIDPHQGPSAGIAVPGHGARAVRDFPRALESTRAARHFVLDALGARGDDTLAVDAAIVTAELAANAVLHARSDFTVAVSRSAAGVRISVRDAAPLESTIGHAQLAVSPGHGLWVVAQVAESWAVEPLPDGKVVWAELPASSR